VDIDITAIGCKAATNSSAYTAATACD